MTQEQIIHVSMINSFNVITGRNTFEEIIRSDVSVFAHSPDEDIPLELLELMIDYFASFEMFEKCSELIDYKNENYNTDGTIKYNGCECILPEITDYSRNMCCGHCNKRLKK